MSTSSEHTHARTHTIFSLTPRIYSVDDFYANAIEVENAPNKLSGREWGRPKEPKQNETQEVEAKGSRKSKETNKTPMAEERTVDFSSTKKHFS